MRRILGRLAVVAMLTAAPVAAITTTTAVGTAAPLDCPGGQYWEPSTNTCMPLGQGPTPLECPPGEWWNPYGNVCRPLGQL